MIKKIFLILIIIMFAFQIAEAGNKLQYRFKKVGKITNTFARTSLIKTDTLKILAIRVEFKQEKTELTNGDGTFNSAVLNSPKYKIDPPPHDKKYFENHLTAVKNYYKKVSNGKLEITFKVFPTDNSLSYKLDKTMREYNPATTEQALDRGLAELFKDSWIKALEDTAVFNNFSKYNCFIIFHAGAGSDFNLDFDQTISDIPSVFIDSDFLSRNIGISEISVTRNNTTVKIKKGIILPETENQKDLEVEFGLNGTIVLMLGSFLGLPSLYDTNTGLSGIGTFGLMDQGSANFNGLIPAPPEAWSKVFLGWVIPEIISKTTNSVKIDTKKIYKIPINSREYFLIENRQRDLGNDNIKMKVAKPSGEIVNVLGIIDKEPPVIDGVVIDVDEYDSAIPGSGILIWHVDENVIRKNLSSNTVNIDPKHRGVDLEEADGSQDIGIKFETPFGTIIGSGTEADAYYKSNKSPIYKNEFSPTSSPNSKSYSGANSGITIKNFSENSSEITFDVEISFARKGFPVKINQEISSSSPVVADLDGDGKKEIIVGSNTGMVTILNDTGKVLNTNGVFPNDNLSDKNFVTSPTLTNLNGDGLTDIISISSSGSTLYGLKSEDNDGNGKIDKISQFFTYSPDSNAKITTSPVAISDGLISVGTSDGKFTDVAFNSTKNFDGSSIGGIAVDTSNGITYVITTSKGSIFTLRPVLGTSGTIILKLENISNSPLGYPALGYINKDNVLDIVAVNLKGDIFAYDFNGKQLFKTIHTGVSVSAPPVIVDFDLNGYMDIIVSGENKIFSYNYNGTLLNNFPITIKNNMSIGEVKSSPLIADINADGKPEIVFSAPDGNIYAYKSNTEIVDGFPLSMGGAGASTIVVTDLDGDGLTTEIVATSQDSNLYVWEIGSKYTIPQWGMYLKDPKHSAANYSKVSPPSPNTKAELMPKKSVYNYPNPTRGNSTTIRYKLLDKADVNIKIFDLAGDLVDELKGTSFENTENEVVWNLDNIQSGVYIARVSAKGSKKTSVVTFKIAVVK